MERTERARIEEMVQRDPELRSLWEEHLDLERQLETLDQKRYPTPSEQLERKRIQKRKLAGKDRIAQILARQTA